jgi:hypothetical protein
MSRAQSELNSNVIEGRLHTVRFVGGAAAVTKAAGDGVTVTYTATGRVTLSWSAAINPGNFVSIVGHCFQANTPGDVKNYEVIAEPYNATTRTIILNMYESGTLTDLAALEWLSITFMFQETKGIF